MYLALGIVFESGLTGSIGVQAYQSMETVVRLTEHLGTMPDEILIIGNDLVGPVVIEHWVRYKDYGYEND